MMKTGSVCGEKESISDLIFFLLLSCQASWFLVGESTLYCTWHNKTTFTFSCDPRRNSNPPRNHILFIQRSTSNRAYSYSNNNYNNFMYIYFTLNANRFNIVSSEFFGTECPHIRADLGVWVWCVYILFSICFYFAHNLIIYT